MIDVRSTLEELYNHGASDVFVEVELPLSFRTGGKLAYLNSIRLEPQDAKDFVDSLYLLAGGRTEERLIYGGEDLFSFSLDRIMRVRVSAFRSQGSFSAVLRLIRFDLPSPEELRIPEEVMRLSELESGLVLITGAPGSGRSTTLACLIQRINETRPAHIITLEDPIEYRIIHDKSIVSQREIHTDTKSFLTGMTAAFRQSPEVILLGELGISEMIMLSIRAAESGCLVLAPMTVKNAGDVKKRLVAEFEPDRREEMLERISAVLKAVVEEELVLNEVANLVPRFQVLSS